MYLYYRAICDTLEFYELTNLLLYKSSKFEIRNNHELVGTLLKVLTLPHSYHQGNVSSK